MTVLHWTWVGVVGFGATLSVGAQQVTAASQLSPRAAYEEAMHPLDATRKSISNWSDAEVQALTVAVQRAAEACAARDLHAFSGGPLIDLARLCALGQAWPAVIETTSAYIAAETPSKPLLIQAYAARLDAYLHLKNEAPAFADGKALLMAAPYDGLASEVIDEAIEYMQFSNTDHALALAGLREPLLVGRMREAEAAAHVSEARHGAPGVEVTRAPPPFVLAPIPSVHELYAQGVALAAMQQLTHQPAAATATIAELDAALPMKLTPDESIPISAARRRYALLGQPLPQIAATVNLGPPNRLPTLPALNAITALMLFPDWCTQCVRMGTKFPPTVFEVSGHEAYFFGLLAETSVTAMPTGGPVAGVAAKLTARQLLADTPTLVVAPSVLNQFVANDFPYLVVADSHGIVRVVQPVDESSLQFGGTVDRAVGCVGDLWPTTPKAAEAAKSPVAQ